MIDDLRHFRADGERMHRLAVTLAISAAVLLSITILSMVAPAPAKLGEAHAEQTTGKHLPTDKELAALYAEMIVACAQGGAFAIDDLMVFCDPQNLRVRK